MSKTIQQLSFKLYFLRIIHYLQRSLFSTAEQLVRGQYFGDKPWKNITVTWHHGNNNIIEEDSLVTETVKYFYQESIKY